MKRGVLNIFMVFGILLILILAIMLLPNIVTLSAGVAPLANTGLASAWYILFPALFFFLILIYAFTTVA